MVVEWWTNQPNDYRGAENCVLIHLENKWADRRCDQTHGFICYDESSSSTVMIDSTKVNWLEAQQFCREHHTDLMSGQDQGKYPDSSSYYYWIGLSRDAWAWSDGSDSSFRTWNSDVNPLKHKCAALRAQGRWESDACDLKKPFICHGGLKTQKTLVRISLSSAVDLNSHDSSVLKQLNDHFRANNLHVKLSWKRGNDGKVFQKQDEKKTSCDDLFMV
ncbi:snaclec alboaggregin-B subunit beta-like [Eucyclogobius newberryi]|uniref:snaclec alboaggregin-B subunit beta-like n=1 Tax=Eucyclogobius newberryi TaxID=166745 RepID=UPI003B5BECBA